MNAASVAKSRSKAKWDRNNAKRKLKRDKAKKEKLQQFGRHNWPKHIPKPSGWTTEKMDTLVVEENKPTTTQPILKQKFMATAKGDNDPTRGRTQTNSRPNDKQGILK
mgnify:CR=1 FL=1